MNIKMLLPLLFQTWYTRARNPMPSSANIKDDESVATPESCRSEDTAGRTGRPACSGPLHHQNCTAFRVRPLRPPPGDRFASKHNCTGNLCSLRVKTEYHLRRKHRISGGRSEERR